MRQPIQIGYFNQSVFTVCVRYKYALSFGPVMKWKESADKSTGGEYQRLVFDKRLLFLFRKFSEKVVGIVMY
jgi:hypothetical protein